MQRSPDLQYERSEMVGEGTYGKVYVAVDRKTNEKVALKKMTLQTNSNGIPTIVMREVALLKELSTHPNIVTLKDVLYHEQTLYLVFEWLDQDLRQFLESVPKLEPLLVQSYLYQILQGIRACHANRILHRDLKPSNLLIDRSGRLKLADFGLSRGYDFPVGDRPFTTEVVTLRYRAPEVLLKHEYSTPIDLWSIGCIFAEMASKRVLFDGDNEIQQLHKIFRVLGTPSSLTSNNSSSSSSSSSSSLFHFPSYERQNISEIIPELDSHGIHLLNKLLALEPTERISANAALVHPYFTTFKTFLSQNNSPTDIQEWWTD